MAKQETQRNHNVEPAEQELYPFPWDMRSVCIQFENFGKRFKVIKEIETPGLPSEHSIKEELESTDGRSTEIIVYRQRGICSPARWIPIGSITLKGQDLQRKRIESVCYSFEWEINGIDSLMPNIIKSTLRTGEKDTKHKMLSARDKPELGKVSALIEELSDIFPPFPETNKVISTGKETKGPKKNIFSQVKQMLKRI